MKRRSFILASIALGTALGIPVFYKRHQLRKWERLPLIHPVILSHFCDKETIQNIGSSYRSIVPAENSEGQLHTLLLKSLEGKESVLSDPAIVGNLLEWRIQQDFNAEKIINVNGWVISVTEARQCALLTFS